MRAPRLFGAVRGDDLEEYVSRHYGNELAGYLRRKRKRNGGDCGREEKRREEKRGGEKRKDVDWETEVRTVLREGYHCADGALQCGTRHGAPGRKWRRLFPGSGRVLAGGSKRLRRIAADQHVHCQESSRANRSCRDRDERS